MFVKMKKKTRVYIGLGSNMGNKEENIVKSVDIIKENHTLISKSNLYTSEPWGFNSDSTFINAVICIETMDDPDSLFEFLKNIEQQFGRDKKKSIGYEDRVIDLDILFFGDKILENEILSIPHKQIQNRKFVLVPMNEIASKFCHPQLNMTINELLEICPDSSIMEQLIYKL